MQATAHRLEKLFNPRSIAIIGASDRNLYSRLSYKALTQVGFTGALHLVNRSGAEAFGRPTITRCTDIGEPIDAAYICVPIGGVLDAAADAAAAGVRNIAVLSSGFAEIGGEGIDLQARLLEICEANGMNLLGPNCLGYVNNIDGSAMGSVNFSPATTRGTIAIISASGAIGTFLNRFGQQSGVDTTHIICVGNEADVTTSDILDYLVDHPEVKAVVMFIESIKDGPGFIRAAQKARDMRKPIVVLKAGRSEATAAVVAAHTGALVGNDRAFDAACKALGMIRVTTFEDLIHTAHLASRTGVLEASGIAGVTFSGGACSMLSDLAEDYGVEMPPFSPVQRGELDDVISDLGHSLNPLDLTGAAVRDPSLWRQSMEVIARDPQIGLIMAVGELPTAEGPDMTGAREAIAEGIARIGLPVGLVGALTQPVNEHGVAFIKESGAAFGINGYDAAMSALGHVGRWSRRVREARPLRPLPELSHQRPVGERESLAYLAERGVPVIPGTIARSRTEAVAAAGEDAVVLKIASPDIAHKSDVGGVIVNRRGAPDVGDAYDAIRSSVARLSPGARIDGVIVSPMRTGGVEMFVGVTRDPLWGPMISIGLGGIFIEVLRDSSLDLLPLDHKGVLDALDGLRGAAILQGARGRSPVDRERLADVIVAIADAALALGPDLDAFEINPLLVDGDRVEALDALAIWRE
jgi:acyl-CoA synthetase (NDP forming)